MKTSYETIIMLDHFLFRDLHPQVLMGTASDRYAGWIGQIYSQGRYEGRISRRQKRVGDKTFAEESLPVESVEEYFQHFRVLELDFTFYRPLLDDSGKPSITYQVIREYGRHLGKEDRLVLKVPQVFFAKILLEKGAYVENRQYLDPDAFKRQFYEPVRELLDPWIEGLVFEQEYQRKDHRTPVEAFVKGLDAFFSAIPQDDRYHVELRTEALLNQEVFSVFERHGIGQVLSHWTWLPSLSRQFQLSGRRFLNRKRSCVVRLMTPRGVRYEEAYAKAHPFNALVEGMMSPKMVPETIDMMKRAIQEKGRINVIINNRAGGNAPLMAREIAKAFEAVK